MTTRFCDIVNIISISEPFYKAAAHFEMFPFKLRVCSNYSSYSVWVVI